jgi:UDP-N-acetyl-D-mannosaminuronate dehydrogenase
MSNSSETLGALIASKNATVGVIGLGYVGLPLGMTFAAAGFRVLGFDLDTAKVGHVNRGHSYIKHIDSDALRDLQQAGKLAATNDFSRIGEMDCVVICVPTPLTAYREPDMSFIIASAEAIAPHVRNQQLFCLESTTYPGTTDEVLRPILERGGLKAGVDFFLAFSPEREDPGNADFNTRNITKVVGGHSDECLSLASALYGTAISSVVPVSSTQVAEMTTRESPSLRIISMLKERGAVVHYHDPFVPELAAGHHLAHTMKSVPLSPAMLGDYDAVLILTNHSTVDYGEVVANAQLVVDTRNATEKLAAKRENVVRA